MALYLQVVQNLFLSALDYSWNLFSLIITGPQGYLRCKCYPRPKSLKVRCPPTTYQTMACDPGPDNVPDTQRGPIIYEDMLCCKDKQTRSKSSKYTEKNEGVYRYSDNDSKSHFKSRSVYTPEFKEEKMHWWQRLLKLRRGRLVFLFYAYYI